MLKLNGAMLWFVYFLRTSSSGVRSVVSEQGAHQVIPAQG
jgi:hypothetical protein